MLKFSRIRASGPFFAQVDGLRFIAIFLVIGFHLNGYMEGSGYTFPLSIVFRSGWSGVELFFVISGFVLSLKFIERHTSGREKPPLKDYYLRRLTRLEPPYFIALTVYLAIKLAMTEDTSLIANYFASLFYVHNILYNDSSAILGAAWSLEIEAQYYLLMPVFGQLFRLQNHCFRRCLLALLILFCMALSHWLDQAEAVTTLLDFLHLFFTGQLIADLSCINTDQKNSANGRETLLWDLAALAAVGGFVFLMSLPIETKIQLMPIVFGPFFLAALRGKALKYLLSRKLIYTIGGMCYSAYLFHTVILRFLVEKTGFVSFAFEHLPPYAAGMLSILVGSVTVFAITALLFAWFERPFMNPRWISKFNKAFSSRVNPVQ